MSKYAPLKHYLESRPGAEAPLSFIEVERILGFPLPASARDWPAWWSNNTGTHVGVKAWRDAGWRTSRVDIGSERVTFVKEQEAATTVAMVHLTDDDGSLRENDYDPVLRAAAHQVYQAVSPGARRMIDDWKEIGNLEIEGAIVGMMNAKARERQRQLVESLPRVKMPEGFDSTALIREDRDR